MVSFFPAFGFVNLFLLICWVQRRPWRENSSTKNVDAYFAEQRANILIEPNELPKKKGRSNAVKALEGNKSVNGCKLDFHLHELCFLCGTFCDAFKCDEKRRSKWFLYFYEILFSPDHRQNLDSSGNTTRCDILFKSDLVPTLSKRCWNEKHFCISHFKS